MSELQTLESANLPDPDRAPAAALPLALIADTDSASRSRRARQLQHRGFRVAVARTVFETIVKASCHLPDLILVAASLGDEQVRETTELLSTCPATAHIPIVRIARGARIPTRFAAAAV
jgi:CheY-like chemotaxis protein